MNLRHALTHSGLIAFHSEEVIGPSILGDDLRRFRLGMQRIRADQQAFNRRTLQQRLSRRDLVGAFADRKNEGKLVQRILLREGETAGCRDCNDCSGNRPDG